MQPSDFAAARRHMLDGQLRPNRVTDPALLDAFATVPREYFVPAAQRARAYADEAVPLAPGRALAAPMPLARLIQLAAPRRGERALVAGAGGGFGAAILAMLGLRVVALEDDAALGALAQAALAALGLTVEWVAAPPAAGHAAAAPYDVVVIEGEVPAIPDALTAQVAPGGRLVAGLGGDGRPRRAVIGRRLGGTFTLLTAFDAALPPLPAFAPEPGFVF